MGNVDEKITGVMHHGEVLGHSRQGAAVDHQIFLRATRRSR